VAPGPLPSRAEAASRLLAEAGAALARDETPLIVAAPPGAMEVLSAFAAAGLPVRAHARVAAWAAAYRRAGIDLPPPARPSPHGVVVWPAGVPLPDGRLGAPCRLAAPDLGDRVDLEGALAYVRHTGAAEVFLIGGAAPALVGALAALGVAARPLGPPRQMDLF
jgi:hypothetical protein